MESSLRWTSIYNKPIKITAALAMLMFLIISPRVGRGEGADPPGVVIVILPNAAGLCDQAYDPPVVTVKAGATVVWTNQDLVTHTLVSGEGEDPCHLKPLPPEMRAIDGGQILQETAYRKTFDKPGVYLYTCHLPMHRMRGKVIVVP